MRRGRFGRAALAAAAVAAISLGVAGCAPISALLNKTSQQLEPSGPLPQAEEPTGGTAESFMTQAVEWQGCGAGRECADVFAPLDWDEPADGTVTLRLVKQVATGGDAIGTLFVNPGGPGASGAQFVADSVDYAVEPDVREKYDVIGWDPRGVASSTQVRCLDTAGMDDYLYGVDDSYDDLEAGSEEWANASLEEVAEFGAACTQESGDLLNHIGTDATVQDLEMMRALVGDDKLSYLGYSYGTYIGARYADAYPDRVGRMVLDGAMDPTSSYADVMREQTRGFEAALRAYVEDCMGRSDCPFDTAGGVDGAMATISDLLDDVDETPLEGDDGRYVTSGTFLTAIITPLYSESNWGYLDDLFVGVSQGDAYMALALADSYYDREGGEYLNNSTEASIAINCVDYPRTDFDLARMRADAAELEAIAPTIGRFQGYGELSCGSWPAEAPTERKPVTGSGAEPILVVGTTGDPATPYRWAVSLAEQLESGVLVTYNGEGHTAYGDSECINAVVDDFLLHGDVPLADPSCS